MTIGLWILGDQLSPTHAALLKQRACPVILVEALAHVRVRPYHKQKLVLVWSAMRHFAAALTQQGYSVTYAESEDFRSALLTWIKTEKITTIQVMAPADKPFAKMLSTIELPCKIEIIPNNQFLWSAGEFVEWAKPRKRLLMEDFYRESRKRFNILMDEAGKPVGGAWNFDKENRKPPKKSDPSFNPPPARWFTPDEITQTVIEKVAGLDFPTYGQIDRFGWAVTRAQALDVLDTFITTRLDTFGPYEDAMVTGQETLWHSLLSPYINLGLLNPLEIVQRVEAAYHDRENAEINSVEGMIRQVMGWREYMRGVYEFMPDDYPDLNWFDHQQPLPEFFWDAKQAKMNCLKQCLTQTEETAYAHHIQRLMVLNNFALIAGISPSAIEQWFHSAYIDAYDWVMQTNVIGMGQYADGGMLASKPYSASANYINKMSDYCKGCEYDHKARTGEKACPFNFFYWDFLDRHHEKLKKQGRMSFILANLNKMDPAELQSIRDAATDWHKAL
jgi:deoxyribodipyrimidine photolyase-related protein